MHFLYNLENKGLIFFKHKPVFDHEGKMVLLSFTVAGKRKKHIPLTSLEEVCNPALVYIKSK